MTSLSVNNLPSVNLPSPSAFLALGEQQTLIDNKRVEHAFNELQFPFKTAKQVVTLIHQKSAETLSLLNWLMVLTSSEQWTDVTENQTKAYAQMIIMYVMSNKSLHSLVANIVLRQHENKLEWATNELRLQFTQQQAPESSALAVVQQLINDRRIDIVRSMKKRRQSVAEFFYKRALFIGPRTHKNYLTNCLISTNNLSSVNVANWFVKNLNEMEEAELKNILNTLREKIEHPENVHEIVINWFSNKLPHTKQSDIQLGKESRKYLAKITRKFEYELFIDALNDQKNIPPHLSSALPRLNSQLVTFLSFYSTYIIDGRIYLPIADSEGAAQFIDGGVNGLIINQTKNDIAFGIFRTKELIFAMSMQEYRFTAKIDGHRQLYEYANIPNDARNRIYIFRTCDSNVNQFFGEDATSGLNALKRVLTHKTDAEFVQDMAKNWPYILQEKLHNLYQLSVNPLTRRRFFGSAVVDGKVTGITEIKRVEHFADQLLQKNIASRKPNKVEADEYGEFISLLIRHDGDVTHSIDKLSGSNMTFYCGVHEGYSHYQSKIYVRRLFYVNFKNQHLKERVLDKVLMNVNGQSVFAASDKTVHYYIYKDKLTGSQYLFVNARFRPVFSKYANPATKEQSGGLIYVQEIIGRIERLG